MSFLDLLVLALAAWRLSSLIAEEEGPWRIFQRLRQHIPLGGLTACVRCMTVVVGIALIPAYLFWPPIAWPFAVSGAALMLMSFSGVKHV